MEITKTKIKVNNTIIKNRTVSSPLGINMANIDGTVTENVISYFSNLAKNDLGMVTIGAVAVSDEGGDTCNTMHSGKAIHLAGLKKLCDSIKKYDATAAIQLFHVGAQGNTNYSKQRVVGPSKYIVPDIGIETEVLTITEIKRIENEFVKSIYQADEAGYDFIELHMAHGYLIHQFLSEHTNKRTDEYGGTEENRFRFIKNIINQIDSERVRKKLAARVTGNDFTEKGLDIKKIKNLISYLDENNFAYYTVTAGIYETAKQKYINMKKGTYWDYSKELKKMTKTAVVAQGNITSVEEGEKILKEEKGDMFGMCQALIADPELVKKSFKNKSQEVFNCLAHIKVGSCHRCRYLKQKNLVFDCVTPVAWRPVDQMISKNERKKDLDFWKNTVNKLHNAN
jgi:2,4-dienoyl-CoA reductase-like NADH-dependent reductase (Old Yellow Enzyme family)